MTDPTKRAAISRGRTAVNHDAQLRATYERALATGFNLGWRAAVDMMANDIAEGIGEEAYLDGLAAGQHEANGELDAIWRAGYADGLRDSDAVLQSLRARIEQ